MTFANVSSNYLSTAMLPAVRQTQQQIATLQIETSTGEYADLGLHLGNQSGYELSLRTQDDLLQALSTSNTIVASNMTSSQDALSSMLSAAQSTAKSLATATSAADGAYNLQTLGQNSLQQFISTANTTAAGGYLFGGQNSSAAPIDDYFASPTSSAKAAIDSAFQGYFGFSTTSPNVANITSTQMQGFLSGPFASQFQSPSWTSNWSNASDDNVTTQIAPGNTIETSTNANTAGFQQLAQGYAMLTEFGNIGLSGGAQQALISAAATNVNSGVSSLIKTQAALGLSQDSVTQASSALTNQMTTLQAQINKMDNIDPAEIATRLTALSTQLETAYQLTSQIHNLNLAQYLPA